MERQHTTISKFGGSGLTDAHSFDRASRIMRDEPSHLHVGVVSALGATSEFPKATNQLYQNQIGPVMNRYRNIAEQLNCQKTLAYIDILESHLPQSQSTELIASRGEWLSAYLLAEYTGARFIDAAELIQVHNHQAEDYSDILISQKLRHESGTVIVPGFYGENRERRVETLTRNGSDVTAAVLAGALHSSRLILWKDVPGIYDTDPKTNPAAQIMPVVDFDYLRQHPSQAIHPDSLRFINSRVTELQIKSVFHPDQVGTRVFQAVPTPQREVSYL